MTWPKAVQEDGERLRVKLSATTDLVLDEQGVSAVSKGGGLWAAPWSQVHRVNVLVKSTGSLYQFLNESDEVLGEVTRIYMPLLDALILNRVPETITLTEERPARRLKSEAEHFGWMLACMSLGTVFAILTGLDYGPRVEIFICLLLASFLFYGIAGTTLFMISSARKSFLNPSVSPIPHPRRSLLIAFAQPRLPDGVYSYPEETIRQKQTKPSYHPAFLGWAAYGIAVVLGYVPLLINSQIEPSIIALACAAFLFVFPCVGGMSHVAARHAWSRRHKLKLAAIVVRDGKLFIQDGEDLWEPEAYTLSAAEGDGLLSVHVEGSRITYFPRTMWRQQAR